MAKLLGFSYPGGPVIDALAPYGNPHAVPFTLARMKGNALDFSFSGLKTAVLRWTRQRSMDAEIQARRRLLKSNPRPTVEQWLQVTPQETLDLLASFQYTVIQELLRRAAASAAQIQACAILVGGGVACNQGLRRSAAELELNLPVLFASPGLSTDNAAMIAAAAYPKLLREEFSDFTLRASAGLKLA